MDSLDWPALGQISHFHVAVGVLPARHAIIGVPMKARVFVTPKSTVLDPQGQAVCAALHGLGFAAITEVRQGKFFEIALSSGISRQQAQTDIETIAHEVLANPVIEEYRVEILD
jgi:phosphoribosylformylglycinamidine synthase PurS subunit